MSKPVATLAIDDPILTSFAEEVGATDAVAIVGGKTRWDLGGAPTGDPRLIHAPTGVVQYKPEEMTIAVRAGTTVSELHATLAERGQRTALPERGGTIGGALVVGQNDIRALGRGRVRESLLQVRYVSAEGELVSSGGPTVKNVSGFDLPRLLVGSLGTLGLIAEVILRTNPIPAVSRWFHASEVSADLAFDTLLHPSAVLTNGVDAWVQLEGHQPDVDSQYSLLEDLGPFSEVEGPPVLPAHRWSVAPAEVSTFDHGAFIGAVGLGLVFADVPQPERTLAPAVSVIHQRMKENFDPTGRLNPGRDAGRI